MLGALTYHAITALAKQRLEAIDARLLAKIHSLNAVSPLERQVRFLAKKAHESMGLAPHLPTEQSLPPFARSLSVYTVFGSIGPSYPQFAARFAPSSRWLYDTIHGGNPDPNRQRVMARSTDLLLGMSDHWASLINASDAADKPGELKKANAYLLGHACHIAADIVSSPFIRAAAWELGDGGRTQLTTDRVAGAIEAATAQLFRRDLVTGAQSARGDIYKDWWIKEKDLPVKFFDVFKDTLELVYGAGAAPQLRPSTAGATSLSPQTSRAFWKQFQDDAPPTLSLRLLEDGYSTFLASMESNYVWNWGDWLAATAWIFFPPIAAYPLIVAMPHSRALFKEGATVDGQPVDKERGWFGVVMAPLATSALAPVLLSIYIAALTYFGVGRETIFGWIVGGLNFITTIVFLASMGTNVSPVVRWLLLFIIPFVGLLVHGIYVLARGGSDPRHKQLALGSLAPCIVTAIYVLFHVVWHQSQDLGMNGWMKESNGKREEWGNAGFIGGWAVWSGMLVAAWMILSDILVDNKDPEPVDQSFVTGQKHFLRLFGHSSLIVDTSLSSTPNEEARNPSLAIQYYPTERRPLLHIWWEGAGDIFLRSDRNALQFNTKVDGTGTAQTILATAAPMTAAQFAKFLNRAVQEGAAFSNKLKAELADSDDFDYVLAPGDVFSDNGDDKATLTDHDTESAKFIKLKTTKADPTILFHAPRAALATFQGTLGPVLVDFDRTSVVAGAGQATFAGAAVTGNATTRFASFFEPGDLIATVGVVAGNETRIVIAVLDDQHLTVSSAFTAGVAGAPRNYQRGIDTRDADSPAGTLQATNTFRLYQGAGFDAMFLPGDIVRATIGSGTPEERVVTQVLSATQMMVDKPFGPAVPLVPSVGPAPPPTPCVRVGRLSREGFQYVPQSPTGIFAGDTLMERAADLAALLAMGTASHLLTPAERAAVTAGADEDRRPAVNPVYQVFRNWNLQERRVNEWQMLAGGNAVSEKRGQPKLPDPLQPGVPSGWTALTEGGEKFANQLGWLPMLEKWLDVAGRPGVNTLADTRVHEGDPTNKELSQGVAFLFDLPMPA